MTTLLIFAFLSGIVTIFAPCIWPILPIVLSAGVSGGKKKPLGLVTGLAVSFIFFTLALASIVKVIPFDPEILRYVAVFIIGFLGLVLLVPWFGDKLEVAVSRLSSVGGRFTSGNGDGFKGGFITGVALGLIWTPCAGPILAAVATLAATQAVGFGTILLITAYVVGVCVPLYILTLVGGKVLARTRVLSAYTGTIQKVFGAVMIVSAILIFTGYDRKLQTSILEKFPSYGSFLYTFDKKAENTGQLESLRNGGEAVKNTQKEVLKVDLTSKKPAPEFVGISNWLNSEALTLKELRGKVVLIDFWTYTCINCIRTLPHTTALYEKYKDQGFVIVGVHTPEFVFEQKTENVEEAIKRYNITYPVAQDNDYATWQAYNNRYWPAVYLIDAEGNIRYTHFGEGDYEETEEAVQTLLKEAGQDIDDTKLDAMTDEAPQGGGVRTPETYLGSDRGERLVSPEKIENNEQTFTTPGALKMNEYGFEGTWQVEAERSVASSGSALTLKFRGEKVFLVMKPEEIGENVQVRVLLNGAAITPDASGKDVKNGLITVESDRLYEIINFQGTGKEGTLKLLFEGGKTATYAFTFA